MQNLHDSGKKKPEFDFMQLKESDTDGVTFKTSNGEIVLYHVYSDVCDEWFEIPLEIIQKTYPNKLVDAQDEVDELRRLEKGFSSRSDFEIDQDRDDKLLRGETA